MRLLRHAVGHAALSSDFFLGHAAWRALANRLGIPGVTFRALRHSHASQLINAGVDIVTISRRLGHKKPEVTLRIYAHMFKKDDSAAAKAINDRLG
jgi:integrase